MAANMYDQAAQAQFINTYVPINFGELYRIGAAQKQAVDQAAEQFTTQLQKFGEFRSPSRVDTENYYNMTIGREDFQNAINQTVSNPDYMKDASNRAQLQSLINSVDYAALSQLKESADYQRMGLLMRAKMKAEGRLKDSWDKSDIANYDTLGTGKIFDDITPVAYMNLNELSTPYFNDLKPGFLGTDYVNGTRYVVTGNNMEDLMAVATAKFNDLIDTPQGQKYFEEYLAMNNGDANAAKSQFINAVAQSQIDRTRRPKYDVDPAFIEQLRYSLKAKAAGASEASQVLPDLSRILATTTVQNNLATLGGLTPEERSAVASGQANSEVYQKASRNMSNNLKTAWNSLSKASGINSASRKLLDMISQPLSKEVDTSLLVEGGGEALGKDAKLTNSTANMTLGADMTFGLLGYENGALGYAMSNMQNASDEKQKKAWEDRSVAMATIQQAWYNDQFRDVIVKGSGQVLSDNNEVYHKRKVYIPIDQLRNIGFESISKGDFSKLIGSKVVSLGDIIDKQQIEITQEYDPKTGEVLKGETTKKLTRKKLDDSDLYVEFDATYPLQIGNNEATITRNANYERQIRTLGTKEKYSQAEDSANRYLR